MKRREQMKTRNATSREYQRNQVQYILDCCYVNLMVTPVYNNKWVWSKQRHHIVTYIYTVNIKHEIQTMRQ